jgi:hypothetical protein
MAEDKKQTVILEFEVDVDQSVTSINKLTAANKELRKERNELNLASKEGQARAKEINAQIDQNTAKIKANVSAIEQQKINIGNYKSALDGIHPALGKVATGLDAGVNGLKGMSFAAKAFIATGIGAIIAAVGLALAALTKYFQGSEEGQNRLNKIMAVGAAIFEQFLNVVEAVGEAVFNAINDPQQALKDFGNLVKENIVNRFVGLLELIPNIGKAIGLLFEGKFVEAGQVAFDAMAKVTLGVEGATMKIVTLIDETGKAVERGISYGEKIAALNAKIDKDERKLIEDRAKTNLQVAKLRQQAVELEGEAKIQAVKQAIALEEELSRRETEIAKDRLALAELSIEANGDDKEALNERAEAIAKVAQTEEQAFNNTLKFRKQLESLNEEAAKAEEERAADARARARAESGPADSGESEITNAFATQLKIREDLTQKSNQELAKINQKAADEALIHKQRQADAERDIEFQKLDAAYAVADGIRGLLDSQSDEYKAIATAQTLVSTYAAAAKAYEAAFLPIPTVASPAIGTAFAAAAVLQGIARVAAINQVEFAEGGWTGPGSKYQVAGVVHADEYVTPKHVVNNPAARPHINALESMRLRPYYDGGMVTRAISQPINSNFDVLNIVKNMPPSVVSVKEINAGQRAVKVKQNISKR